MNVKLLAEMRAQLLWVILLCLFQITSADRFVSTGISYLYDNKMWFFCGLCNDAVSR
jgi:hypothetical protein